MEAPGRLSRLPGPARVALAVPAGALPVFAFPAPGLWWWAYGALVPWLWWARGSRGTGQAAAVGWAGGFGYVLAVHRWLWPDLGVFLPVLALLLGAAWVPFGVVAHRFGGRAAGLVVVPAAWSVAELARSWQGLGGPWGLLGASQWQVSPALRVASVGGVWLVSVLVVAVNCALVSLLLSPSARRTACCALAAVAAVTGAAWWWAPRPEPVGVVRVAMVQPGIVTGGSTADAAERRFAASERLTASLAGRAGGAPGLVVWGESSMGFDPAARPDLVARLAELSRRVGAPLLVNVDARAADGSGIRKSAVLFGPDGEVGPRYDKMRLVPFGEYVPARSVLGWATSVGKAAGENRRPGTEPRWQTLPSGPAAGLRIGPLVCFESAFPDMTRHLVAGGAALVVVASSTSGFQESPAPAQHASLGALRAAESGRPVVHATLTGISAAYAADGRRVGAAVGLSERTVAVRELTLTRGETWYARIGDVVPRASAGLLALLAGAAAGKVFGVRRGVVPRSRGRSVRTVRGWPGRRGR
ncbi:apolipoprotein N-acyltransferase [Streptomyces sp. BI20]|uniref:apolipoprotein N-acyltransferase n=1 Tax=Streptomyces sp. BI20 TaxID=3403460 RepID=UPI003C738CBF